LTVRILDSVCFVTEADAASWLLLQASSQLELQQLLQGNSQASSKHVLLDCQLNQPVCPAVMGVGHVGAMGVVHGCAGLLCYMVSAGVGS
jgi:hypothetical protein